MEILVQSAVWETSGVSSGIELATGCRPRQQDHSQTAPAPLKMSTKGIIMPRWRTSVPRFPCVKASSRKVPPM